MPRRNRQYTGRVGDRRWGSSRARPALDEPRWGDVLKEPPIGITATVAVVWAGGMPAAEAHPRPCPTTGTLSGDGGGCIGVAGGYGCIVSIGLLAARYDLPLHAANTLAAPAVLASDIAARALLLDVLDAV